MMFKKMIFGILILFLTSRLLPSQQERILLYQSDITVHKDGTMNVIETIKVIAMGQKIKRGIFRDFPLRYKDGYGNSYRVDFTIIDIKRDGKKENYFTEMIGNGIRIYMGRKDYYLPQGIYTYTLSYKVDRFLGFFQDHTELYWNVTGNFWEFPINRAICIVQLPKDIPLNRIKADGYTGSAGSRDKYFHYKIYPDKRIFYETSMPLNLSEGLSIVAGWPDGYVARPTKAMEFQYFLRDNKGYIIGFAGLVILFLYYFLVWLKVGKDPEKGAIVPLFDPPENLSPSALRYIMKMGFDKECVTSAIINMAVKGHLTIKKNKSTYTLVKKSKNENLLSEEEKNLSKKLFGSNDKLELKQSNHSKISSAIDSVKSILKKNYLTKYFFKNTAYLAPGILISGLTILVILIMGVSQGIENLIAGGFMSIWVAGWTAGIFFLLKYTFQNWISFFSGKSASSFGMSIFFTLFSLPFLAGEFFGLYMLTKFSSPLIIIVLFSMIGLTIIFYYLLKAPTVIGRKIMDKIEGFKMFLVFAEKDRLNLLNPPEKTPELFEKYLPYALALNVENEWTKQFHNVLSAAAKAADQTSYTPHWYYGSGFSLNNIGSSIGSSFSSALSSASTAPSSGGSGFGGGSSGGGGGGGGGGGW
ncbi:MAG: DUF2207 domain-containing protein [Spirochaetes bacterium]|nr:DUF2207 domain-containing protein [Spirochaetota bacterium]